jgi:hypothetical protein
MADRWNIKTFAAVALAVLVLASTTMSGRGLEAASQYAYEVDGIGKVIPAGIYKVTAFEPTVPGVQTSFLYLLTAEGATGVIFEPYFLTRSEKTVGDVTEYIRSKYPDVKRLNLITEAVALKGDVVGYVIRPKDVNFVANGKKDRFTVYVTVPASMQSSGAPGGGK